jgi:hypothetical protein
MVHGHEMMIMVEMHIKMKRMPSIKNFSRTLPCMVRFPNLQENKWHDGRETHIYQYTATNTTTTTQTPQSPPPEQPPPPPPPPHCMFEIACFF